MKMSNKLMAKLKKKVPDDGDSSSVSDVGVEEEMGMMR